MESKDQMLRVFVCSPLSGDIEGNIEKARVYCKYASGRGVSPYAPHILLTQWLDDTIEEERNLGISSGIAFLDACQQLWAFSPTDRIGWTRGMSAERERALKNGIVIRTFVTKNGLIEET